MRPFPKALGKAVAARAEREAVTIRRMRRWVAAIALAQVLLAARERGIIAGFAIKGGHAIELRIRSKARASRDVDVILNVPETTIVDTLRAALAEGWSGFTFTFRDEIQELKHALRIQMATQYRSADWASFELEITADKIVAEDLVEALDLTEFGLDPVAPIPCLNIADQLAQKFHAMTDPNENRPRDLLDIYILAETQVIEDDRLRASIERTFDTRRTHEWPANIELRQGWADEIQTLIADNEFPFSIDDVVAGATRLVARLLGAQISMNYECHFIVLDAHDGVPNGLENALPTNDRMEAFTKMTREEGWRVAHVLRYPSRDVSRAMLFVLERPLDKPAG
jgi:predicted nucleotidyltransferase component of viral defense system